MTTDYLIIGSGISGTFLSWYLQKAGKDFLVIDDGNVSAPSRVAAGIINPVTGRRIAQTWMIDTLLPFAMGAYEDLGASLAVDAIKETSIIDFFTTPQMLNAFRERFAEDPKYLFKPDDEHAYREYFRYDFGFGKIAPAYAINLAAILPAWRAHLEATSLLIKEKFEINELSFTSDGIEYRGTTAEKIIFCNGLEASEYPWFNKLPFALNKGQALVIRSSGLPTTSIYKKGITVVHLNNDFYWIGSSYEWEFADVLPTADFLNASVAQLKSFLKVEFTVEQHVAALRPATLERRPFVGLHPVYPQLAILNGMGTKGCSLAPYFAKQLVDRLVEGRAILPQADVARFTRILSH